MFTVDIRGNTFHYWDTEYHGGEPDDYITIEQNNTNTAIRLDASEFLGLAKMVEQVRPKKYYQ